MALTSDFPPGAYPLVVAHRGASVELPENTLDAFRGALEAGADVVETDVRLTSDGVPVVMHDAHVSRVTDGQGLVHEMTIAEVKRLDASGGRGPRTEVPTLAEGDLHGVACHIPPPERRRIFAEEIAPNL